MLFGKIILALVFVLPASATAMGGRVDVGVSIPLPPAIVFHAPPEMVVIPETYVYVVPDVDVDIFFYGGWWWRPWDGRWYRSQNYSSGWTYYQNVPSFYREVPSGWRNDYRQRRWSGHPWNYQRIPQQQVQRNWSGWEKNKHWEKQNTWGVQGLKPRPQPQAKPQVRVPARHQQSKPQPREVQQKRSQPQQREKQQIREVQLQRQQPQTQRGPQQSRPQQGKPEKGRNDKQDKKQHDQ